MPWFKVDDNLAFHAKVVAAGNPALGLWVRAGAWCAQQLTDGFIPDHMLASLGTKQQAERLVGTGLWDREQGGYRFHGWDERQPSKDDVEAERAAARDRMRELRAKKKGTAQTTPPQVSDVGSDDVQPNERGTSGEVQEMFGNPDPSLPIPSQPVPSVGTPKRTRKKPSTPRPEDFAPKQTHLDLAASLDVDLRAQWPLFIDHHDSKGNTFADWDAALRNWIRNAPKFSGRGHAPPQLRLASNGEPIIGRAADDRR